VIAEFFAPLVKSAQAALRAAAALRHAARLMGRRSRRVERVGDTRPPGRTEFLSGRFCIHRSSAGHAGSRTRLTSRSQARIRPALCPVNWLSLRSVRL